VLSFVPIAPVAGMTVGQASLARAAEVSAHRAATAHETVATLTENAADFTYAGAYGMTTAVPVRARWQAPDGSDRAGWVTANAGSEFGESVPLWVDANGQPTAAPESPGQQRLAASVNGLAAAIAWLILLASGLGIVRGILARQQLRAWGTEWARVEHEWRRELL
jgi:hypothetical protein